MRYARISCFLCLATITSASHAGESRVSSSSISPGGATAVHEYGESNERWPDTAQMVLLGIGLSYVGLRFGKRKT